MSVDLTKVVRAKDMNRFQITAVGLCLAINMLDGFDVLVVAFTAPRIAQEWGLDPKSLGILFSAGLVGMMAGSLFLAPVADRVGRRLIVLFSLVVISVGMLLSALANDLVELASFRVLTGLGIGAMLASLNTIVAECVSDKRRDFAISLLTVGYPIGATIGGIISVFLIAEYGWRAAYVFGGVMSAIMIPVVIAQLPESLDFLLARRPKNALERINKLLARFEHPALDVMPEKREEHREHTSIFSVFNKKLLPGTIQICTSFFMVMLTFYFVLSWTPKILVDLGLSESMSISGAVLMNISGIVGGVTLGYLSSIWSLRTLATAYTSVCFVFIALFGFLPAELVALIVGAALIGFFLFGTMVSLYAIAPLIYPATVRNTGMGIAIGIGRLGAIAGPYIAGLLIAAGWDRSQYYLVLAAPLIVAVFTVRSI